MHDSFLLLLVAVNAYLLVTALSNLIYFRRATQKARVKDGPFVSVIVPARDEERSIARCVESLLRQEYAPFEVIVVDDESSDRTAAIVAELAARDARLRLVSGVPMPPGWMGKSHALFEGVTAARGEILILTDADTTHEPQSISWAVTNLQHHRADMLSGYLRQEYGSLGERLIVPTMYAEMLLVPLFLLPRTRSPRLSFAIGQYVVLRAEALEAIGGYWAIGESIVDDVAMATRMKEFGYRNVFLDANAAAGCRLYSGYRDAFTGIRRSIYSALGANPFSVVMVATVILGVIVVPALSVLASSVSLEMPAAPVAASMTIFAVLWALVSWDRDVPFVAFALYPLVFLNLVIIMTASMLATGFGRGVDWKGRTVRVPKDAGTAAEAELADAATRSAKVR